MKHLDEFRDRHAAESLARRIALEATRSWSVMEVCGGQTHTIMKYGLEDLLPPEIRLLHGPGCPVCVTPVELIQKAVAIASRPEVIFCSFGDMLRVPSPVGSLLEAKARGGDVRMLYSPLDALRIAESHPDRRVVFFAVGFETTAPSTAQTVREAYRRGLENFSLLCAHVLVLPAMEMLLSSGAGRIDAFLAAGHVCTVTGCEIYDPLARRYAVPIVVTGFEPLDILQGILMAVRQKEAGRSAVENQYARSVQPEGNRPARLLLEETFDIVDRPWRGLGTIPCSGYALKETYARHDAERIFDLDPSAAGEPSLCIAGAVLQGLRKPDECPAFGASCTPESPLGAPMVSSEGACAASYRYRR